jgi:hypothetical protein
MYINFIDKTIININFTILQSTEPLDCDQNQDDFLCFCDTGYTLNRDGITCDSMLPMIFLSFCCNDGLKQISMSVRWILVIPTLTAPIQVGVLLALVDLDIQGMDSPVMVCCGNVSVFNNIHDFFFTHICYSYSTTYFLGWDWNGQRWQGFPFNLSIDW